MEQKHDGVDTDIQLVVPRTRDLSLCMEKRRVNTLSDRSERFIPEISVYYRRVLSLLADILPIKTKNDRKNNKTYTSSLQMIENKKMKIRRGTEAPPLKT